MAFRLFTTYFDSGIPERRAEMDLALSANVSVFDVVYVLSDCPNWPDVDGSKIVWLFHLDRPKFSDAISAASKYAQDIDISVIANGDIYIPHSAMLDANGLLEPNQTYCLNRWEMGKGLHLWDVEYAQDAWVFRGPPKPNIGGDYWFGVPGCDNRFAHELDAAGYEVLNPSKDIRTYHIHASQQRTQTNTEAHRVPPPYMYVTPHHLGEQPKRMHAATWEQRKRVIAGRKVRA